LIKSFLISLAFVVMFLVRPSNAAVLDYQLWFMFLCAASALILDFMEYYRDFGYASTLTLNLAALIFLMVGRLGITILTLVRTCFLGPLIGVIIISPQDAYLYALFGAGMALALGTLMVHLLTGRPVPFVDTVPYSHILGKLRRNLEKAYSSALARPAVTGFVLGFLFRLLPEIYWWPWLIGWDTVEYLAHLRDFVTSLNPFQPYYWMGNLRHIPPLMNMVLAPFAFFADDWILMKLYPPVCYGFLTAAAAHLSARVLNLKGRYLLASILASIFFFLNLRISWDYQRQLLGSVFSVLAVASLEINGYSNNVRRQVLPASMLVLSAMSHEVTAYLAALLSLSAMGYSLIKDRKSPKVIPYLLSAAASIMLLAWYARKVIWPSRFFGAVPAGVVSYGIPSIGESLAYLVAGYGLLIPFALMGANKTGVYYKLALIFLFAAGLSPLIAPKTAIATWYRFLIAASPFMVPLAFKGATALDRRYLAIYLIVLMLPGLCFYTPCEGAHTWKLVSAIREFPGSMTPVPTSRIALKDLRDLSQFIGELNSEVPIIVDAATARWIHLGLRNPNPSKLIWLWRDPTLKDVISYLKRWNLAKVYLVTWKPEAKLILELGENGGDLRSDLQIKIIRNGIHKIYEISMP